MISMHGDTSVLFRRYVAGRKKAIFPWSLSIVDCLTISGAFMNVSGSVPVTLSRISAEGKQVERIDIGDAYDMYEVDSAADGFEVVLSHESSGSACYWDVHERFVVVTGSDDFLALVRPYPADIERHRYVEAMVGAKWARQSEMSPEQVYDILACDVSPVESQS